MNKKIGYKLWLQQIQALLIKRFYLFKGRYVLGFITLVLTILLEGIVCYILPIEANTINSIEQTVRYAGNYTFKLENYKSFTMPYSITGNVSESSFTELFQKLYTRPGLKLEQFSNDTIASYVLEKRKKDLNDLVNNNYIGMSFEIYNSTNFYATGYFSTLAYHSSASVINEITNLLLAFHDSTKLNKTISTCNAPIPTNDSMFGNSNFLRYLACIDILPLSMLNYINGVIFAIFISFFVVHVGKERINGSKHLQLLSGAHYITYWIANFIFDFAICLYTISGVVGVIKLVDYVRNEPLSETYSIVNGANFGYLFLLLLISSFGWVVYAYVVSHFFKSEIIGFIVLLVVLGMAAFMDMVWCFFQLFISINLEKSTFKSIIGHILEAIRWIFVILFPNVTIKRGLFDLKVRQSTFCIDTINNFLESINLFFCKFKIYLCAYIQEDFQYNEVPISFSEPGIGSLIFISILQFLVALGILCILEEKINFKRILCRNSVHAKYSPTMVKTFQDS